MLDLYVVLLFFFFLFLFFFFKQKTAYEIYQCDWSSDVCSSDLVQYWIFCILTGQNYRSSNLALFEFNLDTKKDGAAFMRNTKHQIKILTINLSAVAEKKSNKKLGTAIANNGLSAFIL